jgi:hypothetical protein
MQTELECRVKNNELVFKFIYWDENGEYIKRTEKLELLSGGRQVQDSELWSVNNVRKNELTGEMMLELITNDNGKKERCPMKKVITVSNRKLSITKNQIGEENNVLYSFNFDKTVHKF